MTLPTSAEAWERSTASFAAIGQGASQVNPILLLAAIGLMITVGIVIAPLVREIVKRPAVLVTVLVVVAVAGAGAYL